MEFCQLKSTSFWKTVFLFVM